MRHTPVNFKTATVLLIIIAAVLGGLSLLVPLPAWSLPYTLKETMVFATIVSVLHFGAPYLFHIGLSQFTAQLRRAYLLMFVGIILLGIAHGQNIIITVTGQWNGIWVRSGLIAIPFFLALIFIYMGAVRFARLLAIPSILTKPAIAFTIAALISTLAAFIPPVHVAPGLNFAMSMALTAWVITLFGITAIVIKKIQAAINSRYTAAMTWLFWSMVANAIAGVHYMVMLIILPEDHWYEPFGFVPFLIAALVLVRAGYAFNLINNAKSPITSGEATTNHTPVDVIISLAELASQPSDIDPMLDGLRTITANSAGHALSDSEQASLGDIFLKLQQYLVTQEKLKTYTIEDVNNLIANHYDANSNNYSVFWKTLHQQTR